MTIVNGFDKVIVSLGNECRRVRVRESQNNGPANECREDAIVEKNHHVRFFLGEAF